ncbi:MAG: histidine kinase dimerization/phospho-acceptor domain-containing protein, partial [Gemmatimonadales bacterium]
MIPAPEGSSHRSWRLRTVLIFMLIAVALYASGFSAYLLLRIGPAAEQLREDTSPVLFLFGRLAERSHALDDAVDEARRVVTARTRSEQDIAALRARVQWQNQVAGPEPFARIPLDMRIALARTDEHASRLESKLTEVYALVELGRFDEAESRMRVVDLLHDRVSSSLAEAERLGLRDLVDREIALEATLRQAVQAVLWWVVVGALLLPLGLFFIRQRLERPLRDIDRGFARVAEGDLHATVPIRRLDEIGRLAAHFNEMTRVLRMRAEQQGRFAAAGELLAGVAHEVNNPLMAICAVAENRLDDPSLSEDQREELGQIIRQAQRAGKLLSGLLRFVRAEQERVGSVDLNMVVRAAVDLVSYQFTVD